MHSRPTTSAILEDLARELREQVMPLVDDPAARVNLEMMEQLLTAAAVRSAHEIAWMAEEVESMIGFANEVLDRTSDVAVQGALDQFHDRRSASLHLDDQVENYSLAGEAFGLALEASASDTELLAKGADLIRARRDTETRIRPGFYFPGRS